MPTLCLRIFFDLSFRDALVNSPKIWTWIKTHSEFVKKNLKNVSLLILAGPMELESPQINIAIDKNPEHPLKFQTTLPEWHYVEEYIPRDRTQKSWLERYTIPIQIFLTLGAKETEFNIQPSMCSTKLHDACFRFTWPKQDE